MKNNVIFFSIDRLGDYLIRSNTIKEITEKHNYSEIVCSDKNYKLISTQKFFSKIVVFKNKFKLINKLIFICLYIFRKYDTCIIFDGKNISNLILLLIRSDFKFTFLYIKKGFFNKIKLKLMINLYQLLNIKYEFLYSRDLIESHHLDNYPLKYKCLDSYFKNVKKDIYYYENNTNDIYNIFKNQFIVIHLDEKLIDIENINKDFSEALHELQKKIKKKIFLTSFKNNFDYYNSLSHEKIEFKNMNIEKLKKSSVLIIEDLPLDHMFNLMKNSLLNISCHSGYFIHTSLSLNIKTIDILNEFDENWYKTWIYNTDKYKVIYKSTSKSKICIRNILNSIGDEISL
jgi:hypothetical protein